MKQLQLSGKLGIGKTILVDDADYEYLSQFTWWVQKAKNTLYAIRYNPETKKRQLMHRLLFNLTDSRVFIDHINHNGLDNQKNNLRICTNADNQKNKKGNGTSSYLGVSKYTYKNGTTNKKWIATIKHNGKYKYLGIFENEIDAAKSYNKAALEYHGEFANLNKI